MILTAYTDDQFTMLLDSFRDDPIVVKYMRILALCFIERFNCPKDLRKELLPAIEARANQARIQLKGRRVQLLKAFNEAPYKVINQQTGLEEVRGSYEVCQAFMATERGMGLYHTNGHSTPIKTN